MRAAIGVTLGQAAYMLRVTPEVYAEYEAGTKRMHPGLFRLLRFEAGLLAPHGGD